MQVREKIIEIIAAQALLKPEDVATDQSLEALGIDSLGLVEAIFAIEEAFDVSVPFNAHEQGPRDFDTSSVDAVIAAVKKLIDERS